MNEEGVGMLRLRIFSALFLIAAAAAFADTPKPMFVQVKETQVRAADSFLSKILDKLVYGDKVQVISEKNGWAKVSLRSGKGEGWVNLSALTKKKVVLKAGSENVAQSASSGEVALAGKGFNQDVENRYKEEEKVDYTWVDRMAKFTVTPEQVAAFLKQGGVTPQGGAQ
jgi:uncharacterized protein YgiM (DUF1202 family)